MSRIAALAALALLATPALAAPQAKAPSAQDAARPASATVPARCPDSVGAYMDSRAPAAFVKKCMGKPALEDHNADGRFVYMYELNGGQTMLGFLFDKDGLLIRPVGYGKN